MGKSSNSHGKKTDKETQSPLLKIFKDIMQKEHNDLEKATLVREKRKKKRKQHNSHQSKSDQKSGETSGADRMKNAQYNVAERNRAYSGTRSQSYPFQTEKRDSWWLWGETCSKQHEEPSTCLCVSCQLKKMMSNEYACIGCLIFVFTISVLAAFLLVFKTITVTPETEKLPETVGITNRQIDSNSMTNKLNKLQSQHRANDYRKLDFGRDIRRSIWDENLKSLDARLAESDFGDSRFQEMVSVGDDNFPSGGSSARLRLKPFDLAQSGLSPNSELSSILDPSKFNDAQISPRLKSFYKKLMETDAQINNLKKGIYDNPSVTIVGNSNSLFRLKRSLFHHHKTTKKNKIGKATITTTSIKGKQQTKIEKEGEQDSPKDKIVDKAIKKAKEPKSKPHEHHRLLDGVIEVKNNVHKKQNRRQKRLENGTEPREIVFEKKQLIVQYLDKNPKFPKCTHAPKELKTHEHQINHPYYKNTRRLDELLDDFLDKNLHDMVSDEIGINKALGKQKKPKCSKHTSHATTKIEPTDQPTESTTATSETTPGPITRFMQFGYPTERLYNKYLRPNVARAKKLKSELSKFLKTEPVAPKKEYDHRKVDFNDDSDIYYMTPANYEVALSISTLMNLEMYQKRSTDYVSETLLAKIPSRKLMQTDEEGDESLGYEDFKEVLSDDMATYDENEKQGERKKRDDKPFEDAPETPAKYHPPGVFNPNWKGPVPLYPDELNSMMTHIDPETSSKETTKEIPNTQTRTETNDVDYIEDYLTNKYQNLANMAQAYSDYGVLEGKKDELKNVKTQDKEDSRVKMYIGKERTVLGKIAKRDPDGISSRSEGISIQMRPYGQKPCDDNPSELFHSLSRHFRIGKPALKYHNMLGSQTTPVPMHPSFEVVYNPSHHLQAKGKKKEKYNKTDSDYHSFGKVLRSLKSVDFKTSEISSGTSELPWNITNADFTTFLDMPNRAEENTPFSNDTSEGFNIFLYKKNGHKRSVDSELDKFNVTSDKNEIKPLYEAKPQMLDLMKINKSGFQLAKEVKTATDELKNNSDSKTNKVKKTDKEMGAGEFLSLLSNWFSTLAGVSMDTHRNRTKANSNYQTPKSDNVSKDIVYPMYDSDMIDNIGHRSRVLMSVDDGKAKIEKKEGSDGITQRSIIVFATADTSTQTFNTTNIDLTNETKRDAITITRENENEKKEENKTLVKRSASEEQNLVFWNDIYDDEYGIKIDPLDEKIGDKRSLGDLSGDVVKKSAVWIQDKMRMMSDTIKKKSKDSLNKFYKSKKDSQFSADFGPGSDLNELLHKISKREENEVEENSGKHTSFAVLTAHMQDVCKQASDAVQQTRNIRQNEDHESQLASGMMQQLVKLMSELVDFEVQQKTCLRLPSDLKDFLDWLTLPTPTPHHHAHNLKIMPTEEDKLHAMDLVTTPSSETEDMRTDARSECLGTLQAVQTLMQEYSMLSDEDKSKMSGIKEYLEDQLDFLNKQLSSIDELNLANIYAKGVVPFRFRRDASKSQPNKQRRKIPKRYYNRRLKRKLNRFIKTFSKKHTRTTPNSFESLQVSTDVYKKEKKEVDSTADVGKGHENKLLDNNENGSQNNDGREGKTKRNLQDVYYRALADAKKITTVKNLHSSEPVKFDKATLVRPEA